MSRKAARFKQDGQVKEFDQKHLQVFFKNHNLKYFLFYCSKYCQNTYNLSFVVVRYGACSPPSADFNQLRSSVT